MLSPCRGDKGYYGVFCLYQVVSAHFRMWRQVASCGELYLWRRDMVDMIDMIGEKSDRRREIGQHRREM